MNNREDFQNTTIVLGPPGTGKTTFCLQKVTEALSEGVDPRKIGYFTFGKDATEEAISRANRDFGHMRGSFIYFRTIHSLAYQCITLGKKKLNIMTDEEFATFGEHYGYEFSKTVGAGKKRGDFLYNAYAIYRNRKVNDPETIGAYCPNDFDISTEDFINFLTRLKEYKHRLQIYDFFDLLSETKIEIELDLLIIDEAQDLSTLQWDLMLPLVKKAKKCYIVGDDDQSIFTWAGADLNYFLTIPVKNRVLLDLSYRLPPSIFNMSQRVVSQIRHRYEKKFRTVKTYRGRIKDISFEEISECISSYLTQSKHAKDFLVLARTRRSLERVHKQLDSLGIIHEFEGKTVFDSSYPLKAVIAYELTSSGSVLSREEKKSLSYYSIPTGINHTDWRDVFKYKFDSSTISFIQSYIRKHGLARPACHVRLMTIHQAKGLEASNVILICEQDQTELVNRNVNTEEEIRVWYVGITRAKEKLFLVAAEDSPTIARALACA